MAAMTPPVASIPTIDFSPFFNPNNTEAKTHAKQLVTSACSEYGFFRAVNHGVPLQVTNKALELSRKFFSKPLEEKVKCKPGPDIPQPAGYGRQSEWSSDGNEYLSIFAPGSKNNVLPDDPPEFVEVHGEIFTQFTNLASLVEDIMNDCLGLPPNFLKNYNTDRSSDFLVALHYFPATGAEESGKSDHEDGNFFTFVLQDDVGGLEVYQNGQWIPVPPSEGTLVVNVGDILQVLSNDKFKSATHRVLRPIGRDRHSYAFFYNLSGDRWVEPLPHFTTEIGERPKYKKFLYKEYVTLRVMDRIKPPANLDDRIRISHYAI